MAPKGGQETQQRVQDAFEQVSLASAQFGADRDPSQAGIQLSAPAAEIEGVRHFHNGIGLSQRFMTGRDGTFDSDVSPAARLMTREIFEPIVAARNLYVSQMLAERGLAPKGPDFKDAIKAVAALKDQSTNHALAA